VRDRAGKGGSDAENEAHGGQIKDNTALSYPSAGASMSPELGDLIGYPAAILTTAAFVPQAWRSWRTRDMSGISLLMYSLFTLGVALWCAYGVVIGSWPVIVANGITLMLAALVLGLKVRSLMRS
jgi:MtN3 and saliva related transmembrane protein